ncbi:putative nuclease HARBI1 isoform X1 [Eurosta solidaginis]|uniref:putative nuclease HARBI1 isoform X1 n=2 Tax=Eurosta solidaginis TaxID=178769 RepID=UPI0035315D62
MSTWNDFLIILNTGVFMAGAELALMEGARSSKKVPSCRVSPYLRERDEKGRFETDFKNLKSSPSLFQENFRMTPATFEKLYEILLPFLMRKRNTRPNDFISEKAKLAMVLEYFASGDLCRHIASCYRISKQHFGSIVSHVSQAICKALKCQVAECNEETMTAVAKGYKEKWNFPNCIGAIDGKHIQIRAPPKSGSIFYNYKGFHSIVLLASCDASYKFTHIDVGAYGSEGDSNIFKNSTFGSKVLSDQLPFPADTLIDGKKVPHFIVADDAFPLGKRIIKPFAQKTLTTEERIFNYRLSRARRCIENAFGILSTKWLCLRKILFCSPDRAQEIVSACCLLHNFLLNEVREEYCPDTFSGYETNNGEWVIGETENWDSNRNETRFYRGRSSDYGKYVRNVLKEYVNSAQGAVPWQNVAAFV